MCIKCHSGLNNESVYNDLNNALNNESYDVFNKTSICHILYGSLNYNGEDVKKISIELLENYDIWASQYNPEKFGFNLTNLIKQIKTLNYTQEDARKYLNHGGCEELDLLFKNNYTELRKTELMDIDTFFESLEEVN